MDCLLYTFNPPYYSLDLHINLGKSHNELDNIKLDLNYINITK